MPEFSYQALDEQGNLHKGKMRAMNSLDLERSLQTLKLELVTEKEVKNRRFGSKKLARKDLINFLMNLKQLLASGVPILDGLKDIRDSVPKSYFQDVLTNTIESIEGGSTLSESLSQFPSTFDTVFLSLIKVGEETGQLGEVVHQISESLKWADEITAQTKKVMMYPVIVGSIVFAVVCFLMVYLVPKLIPFIQEMGGDIPGYTLALIAVSDFFSAYWQLVVPTPFLIVIAIKILRRSSRRTAFILDMIAIRFPLIGPLNFKLKVARFSNYFALMYSSGITVIDGLKLCEEIMNNLVLNQSILDARNHINEGKLISESFEATKLFPPLVVRMLKIGENTGAIDEALRNISYFYSRDAKEAIAKLEPAMGPIMTVTMGLIMGWIMLAVMGPIYSIIGNM